MKTSHTRIGYLLVACGLLTAHATVYAQSDVTQPGDPIIASTDNSPGSERAPNAIDNQPTKYLNFDTTGVDPMPSGFVVSPSLGMTLVTGVTLQSANDAIERDPKWVRLEGSNDEAPTWDSGAWQVIYENQELPAWDVTFPDDNRFQTQKFTFENDKPFLHYRWTVVEVQGEGANSTQIAEVELLGSVLPGDVTQPGDELIASSDNSPGSETGPNAIDNQPTKYLNFDTTGVDPTPSGFVVTPAVGLTRLIGISLQSANDAIERDPKWMRLEGSNDGSPGWDSGNWEVIYENNAIEPWDVIFPDGDRFKSQVFTFGNSKPFKHYRWTVLEVQGEGANSMQIAEVQLLGEVLPGDVTQPGDTLIASSDNSPGSETGPNAIDNQPTKYLNFDTTGVDPTPSGFVVTPAVGRTVLFGMTIQSANDAVERDPKVVRLEGSNDEAPTWDSGNWSVIYENDDIQPWTVLFEGDDRFQTQTFIFDNQEPYTHYRWTVDSVQGEGANSMQVAEVELLGRSAPVDVTQPGDPLIASSDNSPGSETGPNAIDNQPTKYLNFDTTGVDPVPSGFVVSPSVGSTTIIGISLQSANDAIERDPKSIVLEGSNDEAPTWDSGNWEQIFAKDDIEPWDVVFPDGDRFQTQEFFFENTTSYLHYRWTVLSVQGEGANSMQIAEVELLAFSESADCSKAAFLTQPVDTPVLAGVGGSAEFFTEVNGPWPVQWYKNGEPIAGAVQTRYTTEAIGEGNVDDVYSVEIVGCESSDEVSAFLLQPTDKPVSIGINFVGGGANGAPTRADETNIGGDALQAYWNNLPPEGDGIASGEQFDLVNSLNEVTEISVEWATANRWGSGTGTDDTNAKILNGLVEGGDSADAPATITFTNVPEGSHSVLVYSVARPLEFPVVGYELVETGERVYMEEFNADQHNPDPRFVQATSSDPNNPDPGNFVRFDLIRPVNGTITLNFWDEAADVGNSTINAVQLVLNAIFDPPLDGSLEDSDEDGLPDAWEIALIGDLSSDGTGDFDEDGLSDAEELANKVDPSHKDTDRDGLEDGPEVNTHGSSPAKVDTDGDTLGDFEEVTVYNTDPGDGDTDGDGALDSVEVNPEFNTDPLDPNSVPNVIVAVQSGPWMSPATWGGTAPSAGQKYAALDGIASEISTETGAFLGDSLTLIGSTLIAGHNGPAAANLVMSNADIEVGGSNSLEGTINFVGESNISIGGSSFTVASTLSGGGKLRIVGGTIDEPAGNIEFTGEGSTFGGPIDIIGTDLAGLAPNSLGDGSKLLAGGGLAFGTDASSDISILSIQGDNFRMVLGGTIQVADIVGVDPDGNVLFSLNDLAGPGPYTAEDLLGAFQLDEGITGPGTIELLGTAADMDADGLRDSWENDNFGNLDEGPDGDPDGDGLTNLAEQSGGTDPNVADTVDVPPVDPPDPPVGGPFPYVQNFDGFADGETDLGDGSFILSNDGTNQIQGGALRMTEVNVGGTGAAFILPEFDASGGWTATFDFVIDHTDGGNTPADGFSFNYGDIPEGENFGDPAEEGYGAAVPHISFQIDTWNWNDPAQDAGVGIELAGAELAFKEALGEDGANFKPGERVEASATMSWDPANGASFSTTGLVNNADFVNVPTPDFTPDAFDGFSFLARTGGHTETLIIDNLVVGPLDGGGDSNLVAHFPLDADGNSADGSFVASTVTDVEFGGAGANGNTGTSATFNGTSSVIQHDWSADLNPESFTLALWAKSDGGAGAWNSPVTSRHDLNPDSQGYLIYDNEPAGAWTFWSGNGTVEGNWQTLDGPAVTLGEWEHVAITYDNATETKKLYVNGELVAEANDSITPNDTTPFNIGSGQDFGDGFRFVGQIDDIGLWNIAQDAEAIGQIMTQGVAGFEGGGGPVDPGDGVPPLENVGFTENGVFGITIPDGRTADIEYSTDLENWEVIATDVTGDVEETDAGRIAAPEGYYRATYK